MKKSNLVSVIIATYNREKMLEQAIDSVLAQTYTNFELIIIDDGSRGGPKSHLQNHCDSRIKYFFQQNKGESGARNSGISQATGDFIIFVDDDDCLCDYALELAVKTINENDNYDILYSDSIIFDENNRSYGLSSGRQLPSGDLYRDLVLKYITIVPSGMFFKKNCFDQCLYNEKIKAGTDTEFNIRLSENYLFQFIDKPLVKFRNYMRSREKTIRAKVFGDRINIDIRYQTIINSSKYNSLSLKDKIDITARHLGNVGLCCVTNKKRIKALCYYICSFILYPRIIILPLMVKAIIPDHWIPFIKNVIKNEIFKPGGLKGNFK